MAKSIKFRSGSYRDPGLGHGTHTDRIMPKALTEAPSLSVQPSTGGAVLNMPWPPRSPMRSGYSSTVTQRSIAGCKAMIPGISARWSRRAGARSRPGEAGATNFVGLSNAGSAGSASVMVSIVAIGFSNGRRLPIPAP